MAKKKAAAIKPVKDAGVFDVSQFEVIHSGGFSPIWKPEEKGEYVLFHPLAIRQIEVVQGRKKQMTYIMEANLVNTNSENFYNGKTQSTLGEGDTAAIPISFGLVGDTALGVHEDPTDNDSPILPSGLVNYCITQKEPLMVRFNEKTKTRNGQQFKSFAVLTRPGVREGMAEAR